ncbi:glycosyltransferase family 1 protein [Candidatus Bathyarchaeota archaeon]|nr:MAG: glycosyltransferase family 1 protein [Candidatus Bathyarchaeota archaeon]
MIILDMLRAEILTCVFKRILVSSKHYSLWNDDSMRVFSVFFHPDPSISAVGGAEKRFVETLRILKRRGDVEVTIVESKPSLLWGLGVGCENHEISNPISAHKGGWLGIYVGWIVWSLKALIRCLRIVRGQNYDLVLAPNNTAPNLIPAYFVHHVSHLPLCVIVHHIDVISLFAQPSFSTVYHTYRETGFSRSASLLKTLAFRVILEVLKRCDRCITVSNSTARTLVNNGVPEERVYVTGNGVDVKYIDGFKFEGRKSYTGVFVGRISKEKGVFDLVAAWRRIVEVKDDARLLFVGSGPDIDAVRCRVVELGLERNVVVKGRCADGEMYKLMKASEVFIFPSVFEGWGLTVAEALACGLPVVCYDIPALREVFGKCRSVFLVPIRDVEKLAATVLEVLDVNRTSVLAGTSRNFVKNLSWSKVAMQDLQVLNSCCHN